TCSERKLYETRKLFGVLFQDGALFGSMNLYDNVAFPLREHTKKSETEVRQIVMEKLEMTGLAGSEDKLPGEISGGMRKRAGLARALVLDPEIILCDEPDSGLDPVRTAYLSQLLIDLNAQIDATILIVTHNINVARTVPDNLGMLFRKELVMFGPREVLLTSDEPVVEQFLNGRRVGPIGMSEEKDTAQMAREQAEIGDASVDGDMRGVVPQLEPSPGLPERAGVRRRKDRVMRMLHTLPVAAQQGIVESLTAEDLRRYDIRRESYGVHPEADAGQHAAQTQPVPAAGASHLAGELPTENVAHLPQDSPQAPHAGNEGPCPLPPARPVSPGWGCCGKRAVFSLLAWT